MWDVHGLFDAIIDRFPATDQRLRSDAAILHLLNVESAVVKVQLENDGALNRGEFRALKAPKQGFLDELDIENEGTLFAKWALRGRKGVQLGLEI